MRRVKLTVTFIFVISLILSLIAQSFAYPPFLAKARRFGATDCTFCHVAPEGGAPWNERGQWLIREKVLRGADSVDVDWLQDREPIRKSIKKPALPLETDDNKKSDQIDTDNNQKSDPIEVVGTEKRIALIIGNNAYENSPLRNPINDARAMATALRESGFEVMHFENLSKREMKEQIRAFGKKLSARAIGLFYFSGHGVQVNGKNFLIPVGVNIEKEQDVEYEAVEAGRVLSEMEAAGNRLNIVILDACRNNPFARGFRSDIRGLAVMNAPSGSIIAFSTGPGSVASDGEGNNGLYTQELLNSICIPGLRLEDVFKRVRVAVKAKSNGKQVPWENTALEGDFYFHRN